MQGYSEGQAVDGDRAQFNYQIKYGDDLNYLQNNSLKQTTHFIRWK